MRFAPAFLLPLILHAAAGPRLNFVDAGGGGAACCIVADPSGGGYVIAHVIHNNRTFVSVTKFDSLNHIVSVTDFNGALTGAASAVTLDRQGNLIIVGSTSADDFPLLNALISKKAPQDSAGFVTKLNPSEGRVIFSTLLGGVAG